MQMLRHSQVYSISYASSQGWYANCSFYLKQKHMKSMLIAVLIVGVAVAGTILYLSNEIADDQKQIGYQ